MINMFYMCRRVNALYSLGTFILPVVKITGVTFYCMLSAFVNAATFMVKCMCVTLYTVLKMGREPSLCDYKV